MLLATRGVVFCCFLPVHKSKREAKEVRERVRERRRVKEERRRQQESNVSRKKREKEMHK